MAEKVRECGSEEGSINRLRMEFFEMRSGKNESWYSWVARVKEMAAKADIASMNATSIRALLTIYNYKGPYAQKIRSEFDKNEISLEKASDIYHDEDYAAQFRNLKLVNEESQNRDRRFNNRGQKLKDNKKYKSMVEQKRCMYCYKQTCPRVLNKQKSCPEYKTSICTYCQMLGKNGNGHVLDACIRRWTK